MIIAREVIICSNGVAIIALPSMTVANLEFSSSIHPETLVKPSIARLLLEYWDTFGKEKSNA
jgi:hypothetical protein